MSDTINQVPSTTPDFTTEAANKLAQLFPEIVADGKVDIEKLKTILGVDVDDTRERFGLTWPGKAQAIRAAQTPTTATFQPDKEKSVDWDTTQNVFIEGDNLEVLKVLQKHYYGQIKVIYIDPPYNTGNDFVYSDDYADSIGSYLELTRQVDDAGKLSTNTESDGRFHSNWLNMMYPRLKLARNLLDDDGIIFISIDDSEVANLRLILDEIFGEANFIENYIWESNFRPDNSSRVERENAQHILCYARKKPSLPELVGMQKVTEGLPSLTKNSMKPSTLQFSPDWVEFRLADGTYDAGERSTGYTLEDDLVVHNGRALNDFRLTGRMIWSQDYLEQQAQEGTKIVIKGDGFVPYSKKTSTSDLAPTTLIPREIVGDVLAGNAEIRGIFGSPVFNHPKPTTLLRFLIKSVTAKENKDAIILDFFAGSGSTAHAVTVLNTEDGGNRRCISVQLPEPTPEGSVAREAGFETIADISRERIRRAGEKILEEESSKLDGRPDSPDVGFRAYKLVDTNFTKWRADSGLSEDELVGLFADLADSADDHARPEALLTEVLLKLGFSLTEKIEAVEVAGLSVFSVADGLVLAYLDEHTQPTLDQLRALVGEEPERLVVLEDAFQGNDELKTNLVQECRTRNVDLWTA